MSKENLGDKTGQEAKGFGLNEDINKAWSERGKSKSHYANFQLLAAKEESALYEKFVDLGKKNILDIGCGLGGKTVYYAKKASNTFAVDNKMDDLSFAREFAFSNNTCINFVQANIESLPFKEEYFDIIILNDIIEHLSRPQKALNECKRILKKKGIIFINFPPFYGPNGGHLGYYFSFPWLHLLPRKLISWLLLRKHPEEGWITPQVVLEVFKSTNKMTVKRFLEMINSERLLLQYYEIKSYKPRLFKRFIGCPVVNEFITENARFVLKKI